MDTATAKVFSFAFFIFLGWLLRRRNVLSPETFGAISGLVLYVTLPCVVVTGLNGVDIGGEMAWVVLIGFLSNVLFLGAAVLATLRMKDADMKAFDRLNMSGFSIGPFAIPYVQAFFPTTGLLTALIFDVGNSTMSAGGTYAILAGSRDGATPLALVRGIVSKLMRSGPILSFALMAVLWALGLKLPDAVTTLTQVGASANTFLCMIMIGESINISMAPGAFARIVRLLSLRFVLQCLLAAFFYFCLPFEEEVRRALTLVAFSPVPAMNLIYTAMMRGDLSLAANLSSASVGIAIVMMSVLISIF